jgi:murein DD-endopeptidase MepM/ murein hydrolase activator NlpD
MRYFLALAAVLVAAVAVTLVIAGHSPAPAIRILQPEKAVGTDTVLDVTVEGPQAKFSRLDILLEQNGRTTPLFTLGSPGSATLKQETADRIRISRPIGKRALPDLQAGPLRLVVTAARTTLFGLRTREAFVSKDVTARFTPPRIAAISTHHYINLGGSEMVVYSVSPPDVESGVQVGNEVYPGFPASGAGVKGADTGVKVAFFALLYDQDLATPIRLFARDDAGNEAHASFDFKTFNKPFHRSRIELTDAFLQRVVPEILEHSPELKLAVAPGESLLPAFLRINGDLRRIDADRIVALSRGSSPDLLWNGPFRPLGNAQVESKFADHRTYLYQGREVDQQVHLGFDLAVTVNIPVLAGNDGKVVFADYLGIYGNCIVIDHGMSVQSLYGHLSTIEAKVGDVVTKGQRIGRSGMTGLAGGDHLHFSVQVGGHPVSPVEWWDGHWIEDRVMRKLREAGSPQTP